MTDDPNLVRRNWLLVPGSLLVAWSLLAIVYAYTVRPLAACPDASQVLFFDACREVALVALAPILVGAALLLVGGTVFRPMRHGPRLYPGSGSHVAFAILLSAVLLPLIAVIAVAATDGEVQKTILIFDAEFRLVRVLLVAFGIMLMPFVAFVWTYAAQGRLRDRLVPLVEDRLAEFRPVDEGEEEEWGESDPVYDVDGEIGSYIDLEDES